MGCDGVRRFGTTVLAAVHVSEDRLGCGACDEELAAMDSSVMRSTNGHDVFEFVPATFGTWHNVLQIEKRGIGTAWSLAAFVIAPERGAT